MLLAVVLTVSGVLFGIAMEQGVHVFRRWRKQQQVDEQWAPRPIDPNNPPRYMKYTPKPGRTPLRCTVCCEALTPGDRVLLWPQQSAAYELLCPDCWKVQPQ